MKNLILRSITGVLFVALLVGCIIWHPYSQLALFTIITAMTVFEFASIINKQLNLQINRFTTTASAAYLFIAVWVFNTNLMGAEVFIPYLMSILYILVSELYIDRESNLSNWAYALMAQLYIALPFASFNTLCFINTPAGVSYYFWYALSVFIFLWSSDSGAYIFGCWLGKHRLFPRISPKKSWEGSIGGGITALAASQVIATFVPFSESLDPMLSRILWAGLAIVVVVMGTWGDLVESLIKRKIGVKDSGNILPGHGGMLDRFDSSLLAIPAAVIYVYSIMLYIIH
ncbi:MAG: phosphatidate cytidylyltransferase [Prevotellaceae bacterium]|nr:phosphatidate cytidylyltransferase [Candidatus Minthosoma caballi]